MYKATLLIIITLVCSASFSSTAPTPTPVKDFDIERYQGTWNQLSAIPASFQKNCTSNTTAEYSQLDGGLIKVINSCEQKNKKIKKSEARARINQDYGLNSTLEVTFVKLFDWVWSFSGDYWIIYVNKNYDTVIVGHPDFEYGWILSKKETLTLSEYKKLNQEINMQGYDSCNFIMSNTPDQNFKTEISLCELIENKDHTP